MKLRTSLAATAALLLSYGAASAQTTPAGNSSTTRSTNTVGLGSTVSGTPTSPSTAPVRYDDPNSTLPSSAPRMKGMKNKSTKQPKSSKMKDKM